MVAKPLYFNWGKKQGVVLWPKWVCDNKLPESDLASVTNLLDRYNGPSCGDGPVFIGHHYSESIPGPTDPAGYRWYWDGDVSILSSGNVYSAASHPFFETGGSSLAFEYVGWYIHNGNLFEFNLEGDPDGAYTGQYSYDQLYGVSIVRFYNWGEPRTLQRTSRSYEYGARFYGSWGLPKSHELWVDALKSGSISVIYDRLCAICRDADSHPWDDHRRDYIGVLELGSPRSDPHDLNEFVFPKSQYNYWLSRVADFPGSVSNGINTAFFTDAYYKAIDKLPKLKQNLLANILDIVAALRSFKNGYKAIYSAKDLAASSWLAYRYAYRTTVSDLEEATNYLGRLYYLLDTEATVVRSYGTHQDGGAVYCCALECDFGALMSASLVEKLDKQYNFRLSATNVWDMIPYSFVVDWFLGIGDILEEIDQWLDSASVPVTNIWYSYKESYVTPTGSESVYFRWGGEAPKLPYFTEFYDSKSTSSVTLLKRGLDALALIF